MDHHILLLGAGFSRTWGGWLAAEAFEYLLGCSQVHGSVRELLWSYKDRGGYEEALACLQTAGAQHPGSLVERDLVNLESAILGMFDAMDRAFSQVRDFHAKNNFGASVIGFL